MAKGEGGGGHFDERRRAKAAASGKADSAEVLAAISKPKKAVTKKAPTIVVKKKKAPSRVKVESNSGEPAEAGTKMTVTRYNTERLKPQNTGFVSPKPRLKPQNTGFVSPSVSTLKPQNYGFSGGPGPDLSPQDTGFVGPTHFSPQNTGFVSPEMDYPGNMRQGALEAELRSGRRQQQPIALGHGDYGGPSLNSPQTRGVDTPGTTLYKSSANPTSLSQRKKFRPPGGGKSLADWITALKLDT